MAKVKEKRPRGQGAKGRRIERAEREREAAKILTDFPNDLPFDVHIIGRLPISLVTGFVPDDPEYYWDDAECAIAEEAIERGYALSVRVAPDELAEATARICQNLCRNVWVLYDKAEYRLILWDRDPHEQSGKSIGAKEA